MGSCCTSNSVLPSNKLKIYAVQKEACPNCNDKFDLTKTIKTILICGHFICMGCLQKLRERHIDSCLIDGIKFDPEPKKSRIQSPNKLSNLSEIEFPKTRNKNCVENKSFSFEGANNIGILNKNPCQSTNKTDVPSGFDENAIHNNLSDICKNLSNDNMAKDTNYKQIDMNINPNNDEKATRFGKPKVTSEFITNVIQEIENEDKKSFNSSSESGSSLHDKSKYSKKTIHNIPDEILYKLEKIESLLECKTFNKKNKDIPEEEEDNMFIKEIENCDNGHNLVFYNQGNECLKCGKSEENLGKFCQICNIFYCWLCCGLDFTEDNCICGNELEFYKTNEQCFECDENIKYGKWCLECKIHFCKCCLELEITNLSCPSGHDLIFGKNKNLLLCFSCGEYEAYGSHCAECELINCYRCCNSEITDNKCLIGHDIVYMHRESVCFKCNSQVYYGKFCEICDYFLCYFCSHMKINSNFCFCLKSMEFSKNDSKICIICGGDKSFGKKCDDCSIFLCSDCSELKGTCDKCLDNHALNFYSKEKQLPCYVCNKLDTKGYHCDLCNYFLCEKCKKTLPQSI